VIHAEIPGQPVAQGRPRAFKTRAGRIRTHDPEKSRMWKAEVRAALALAMREAGRSELLAGPVRCRIRSTLLCPRSHYRKRPVGRRWHTHTPDIENLAKAILDASSGVVWIDDGQVCVLELQKLVGGQGEPAHTLVEIEEIAVDPAGWGIR